MLHQLPNALTVIRIALIVPFAWFLYEKQFSTALIIFFIAGVSDGVDGFLARQFNWRSRFGAIADPLADKLLLVTAYIMLALIDQIPDWLLAVVIGRDILILTGALVYHYFISHYDIKPSIFGKACTMIQIVYALSVILILAGWPMPEWVISQGLYVVLLITLISGVHYTIVWTRRGWLELKTRDDWSMSSSQQIALPFGIREDAEFENYYGQINRQAASILRAHLDSDEAAFVYLFGPEGVGKTHLSIAARNHCMSKGRGAIYLSVASLAELPSDAMEELIDYAVQEPLVILEDVQDLADNQVPEALLFRLFNLVKERHNSLLVTADRSVDQLPVALEDLKSRYRSGLTLQLRAMDDGEKQQVLQEAALSRGLEVTEELASFLFKRIPRGMAPVLDVLDQLDRASWANKKKLTIPFVKQVMGW